MGKPHGGKPGLCMPSLNVEKCTDFAVTPETARGLFPLPSDKFVGPAFYCGQTVGRESSAKPNAPFTVAQGLLWPLRPSPKGTRLDYDSERTEPLAALQDVTLSHAAWNGSLLSSKPKW